MGIHPRLPGLTSDREPAEALPAPVLAADAGESRRAFLAKVALGGAALTIGSQLVPATRLLPVSGAQEEGGEALDADETLVEFLVSIGLAGSEAYRAAVASSTPLPEPTVELLEVFGSHHADQAAALLALLPEGYEVVANPGLVEAQTEALGAAGDPAAVLTVLRDLEDVVAATHFAALGALESQPDAAAVGSALPVVAQHATVLSTLIDAEVDAVLPPLQTEEGALDPADYPLGDPAAEEGEGATPSSEGNTTTTANDGGEGAEPGQGGGTGQGEDGTQTEGGGGVDAEGGDVGGDGDAGGGTGPDEG